MHEAQPLEVPLGEVMSLQALLAPVGAFKVIGLLRLVRMSAYRTGA